MGLTNLKFLKSVSLYSCLAVLILAFTVIIQSMTTSANAGVSTLYSCVRGLSNDDNLYQINPETGADAGGTQTITLAGQTVKGCNGLARDPTTGTCWIMINVQAGGAGSPVPTGRILATIDESTGVATQIGIPGIAFASIAFDSSGTLFGVTGDGATPSETLYMLSKTDATPTFFQTLGNGDFGEALAFNPNDGLMYHMSGTDANKVFETINLGDMTVTNIPITGDVLCDVEAGALVHQSGSTFLQHNFTGDSLWSITDSGVCTFLGNMDHISKGLAFGCGEPPECVEDGDCEPSGDVCTPNICESNVCVPDPIPDCCDADSDCADADECTIDVCVNPGPESSCSNDFDVEDDVCFCSLSENEFDPRCFTEGPLVIIPTMGQWGMILATILLGLFAVIAIRRRTE